MNTDNTVIEKWHPEYGYCGTYGDLSIKEAERQAAHGYYFKRVNPDDAD